MLLAVKRLDSVFTDPMLAIHCVYCARSPSSVVVISWFVTRYGDPSWVLVKLRGKRLSDQPVDKPCRIPIEDIIGVRGSTNQIVQSCEVGQIFE